jgi:hypothetical protein
MMLVVPISMTSTVHRVHDRVTPAASDHPVVDRHGQVHGSEDL